MYHSVYSFLKYNFVLYDGRHTHTLNIVEYFIVSIKLSPSCVLFMLVSPFHLVTFIYISMIYVLSYSSLVQLLTCSVQLFRVELVCFVTLPQLSLSSDCVFLFPEYIVNCLRVSGKTCLIAVVECHTNSFHECRNTLLYDMGIDSIQKCSSQSCILLILRSET